MAEETRDTIEGEEALQISNKAAIKGLDLVVGRGEPNTRSLSRGRLEPRRCRRKEVGVLLCIPGIGVEVVEEISRGNPRESLEEGCDGHTRGLETG